MNKHELSTTNANPLLPPIFSGSDVGLADLSSSSLILHKPISLKKVLKTPKTLRTNSENDLLLQLNTLNFKKLTVTSNDNMTMDDAASSSYYNQNNAKDIISLPQIGSNFLFEEDDHEQIRQSQMSLDKIQMRMLSKQHAGESTTRTIKEAITFENDLKHLLKVSLHQKRLIVIIEEFEADLNETFPTSMQRTRALMHATKKTKKKQAQLQMTQSINLLPVKDFPINWKFEFMAAIKYSSFGQSNLVYAQSLKVVDKRKYFFMKKIGTYSIFLTLIAICQGQRMIVKRLEIFMGWALSGFLKPLMII